jgi:hypothetical protein
MVKPFFLSSRKKIAFGFTKRIKWSQTAGPECAFRRPLNCPYKGVHFKEGKMNLGFLILVGVVLYFVLWSLGVFGGKSIKRLWWENRYGYGKKRKRRR